MKLTQLREGLYQDIEAKDIIYHVDTIKEFLEGNELKTISDNEGDIRYMHKDDHECGDDFIVENPTDEQLIKTSNDALGGEYAYDEISYGTGNTIKDITWMIKMGYSNWDIAGFIYDFELGKKNSVEQEILDTINKLREQIIKGEI